jgi:hypothetical protein
MNIEKFSVQSCCGARSIIYKIDRSIDLNMINSFINIGFIEQQHFTKVGILYVDNDEFIITGPIGSNRLQIKCKKKDCDQKLNDFEPILKQLG